METKRKLAAWLYAKNRNYSDGLSLMKTLEITVDNPQFFETQSPSKIHMSLLIRQLSEYARVNHIKPEPMKVLPEPVVKSAPQKPEKPQKEYTSAVNSSKRPKVDKNPVVRYEDLPVNLQVLFDENGKLLGEIKTLHEKLKLLKNKADAKEQRAKLAREIISRQRKNRSNWNEIDSWWAEQNEEEDPIELAKKEVLDKEKRIKANLNYIRRYYGKEKNKAEVSLRMQELDKWGVSYEKLIG